MRVVIFLFCVKALALFATQATAHVAEGGFVLLLPTEAYTTAGVVVVALTVLAVIFVPDWAVTRMVRSRPLRPVSVQAAQTMSSLGSLAAMSFVIYLGLNGPRDPLSNLMPLSFWTLGWIATISLSGLFGNLWLWLNPWTGLYRLLGQVPPLIRLPQWLGHWPACLMLLGFAGFLLADIAPDDPARLAYAVGGYWLITMVGLVIAGPAWLAHFELGQAIMGLYARLSLWRLSDAQAGQGGPGWQIVRHTPTPAVGLFALLLLGVGSFDGVNETFWWMAQIGVNPLEFPGRSAVVTQTLTGLLLANAALVISFALCLGAGWVLCRDKPGIGLAFNWLALSLLPIALAYHIAHYLTSFLVAIQYTVAAISDPFARGADLLGIEPFRVTTGFFNRMETVRVIWLSQAAVVVIGHVWSVLLSHAIALQLCTDSRDATRLTLPLSLFMIAYTMLGLWLLAAPKGA